MKKVLAIALIFIIIYPLQVFAAPNYGNWAKDSIDFANKCGLISEELIIGDYTKPITRDEVAKLIVKAYENTTGKKCVPGENVFNDTYSQYASIVHQLGIMSGRGDGVFSPYDDVTRQEMSKIVLTFKAVAENTQTDLNYFNIPGFSDMENVSEWAIPYVSKACESGIIKGYEDGTFLPLGKVSYQEAIILVLRAGEFNEKAQPTIEHLEDGTVLNSGQSVSFKVNCNSDFRVYAYNFDKGYLSKIGSGVSGKSYTLDYNSLNPESLYYIFVESDGVYSEFVSVYTDRYNLFIDFDDYVTWGAKRISWNQIPDIKRVNVTITEQRNSRNPGDIPPNTPYIYELENQNYVNISMYPNCIYTIEISSGEYYAQKTVVCQGVTGDKFEEVFETYPTTEAEAEQLMVQISVPVWKLSGNRKVSSTATLTVHKDIAEKVKLVFEEIYNGEEKFPIKDVGAYNWRGGTTEHNGGTAIDINSNENYCLYSNGMVVGSHWLPYQDPYSITPYGDVVRAFEKNGFTWGGDAWNSTKDYMHFSYLGT